MWNSARPQLCGGALVSCVKQGEGTALFWFPRGLLHFSGEAAREWGEEAAGTREIPAGKSCGEVEPCVIDQPCR